MKMKGRSCRVWTAVSGGNLGALPGTPGRGSAATDTNRAGTSTPARTSTTAQLRRVVADSQQRRAPRQQPAPRQGTPLFRATRSCPPARNRHQPTPTGPGRTPSLTPATARAGPVQGQRWHAGVHRHAAHASQRRRPPPTHNLASNLAGGRCPTPKRRPGRDGGTTIGRAADGRRAIRRATRRATRARPRATRRTDTLAPTTTRDSAGEWPCRLGNFSARRHRDCFT